MLPLGLDNLNQLDDEEQQRAYDRVHLSEYFGGRDAESLAMCDADYYSSHGVKVHLGEQVLEIDRERKEVVTGSGRQPHRSATSPDSWRCKCQPDWRDPGWPDTNSCRTWGDCSGQCFIWPDLTCYIGHATGATGYRRPVTGNTRC